MGKPGGQGIQKAFSKVVSFPAVRGVRTMCMLCRNRAGRSRTPTIFRTAQSEIEDTHYVAPHYVAQAQVGVPDCWRPGLFAV